MAAAGEKTLAHSRNHVTDLSTESGNLLKMAAKLKSERIWVRGLMTVVTRMDPPKSGIRSETGTE